VKKMWRVRAKEFERAAGRVRAAVDIAGSLKSSLTAENGNR
jgi:hypothetical protein